MPAPITAELVAREPIAAGIAQLSFALREPPRLEFKAGQFVSIAVPSPARSSGDDPDPLPRRSYSIASQSDAGELLRFIIRVIPEGKASEFLMSLPLGARVTMTGPHGFFVLDARHPGDVVFGATGTGFAAVMPMLGELARRREAGIEAPRSLVLWGARQESDLFARDEIGALVTRAGAELRIFLTAAEPGWTGDRGRITPAMLERLPELTAPTFYLVGNGAMISELKRELIARGVNRRAQIRTEAFFD
ncbi:MAG TPA: FAD-binding oxidoreductase [Polyangia bacterium]|nr:FAD-binding oxidoreductase [Polyangia bacterium]